MTETKEIIDFVRSETGHREDMTDNTTLQDDIGIWGDDVSELLENYAKRFSVDMSSFLWYFHTREEGTSPGSLFFKPPNERVEQIPITVAMLRDFANTGTWSVVYPDHYIPKRRTDLLINLIITLTVVIVWVVWIIVKK